MTAPKRAVSYVLFEEPKDLDKKPAEEQQKARKEVVDHVNQFNDKTIAPNADLTKVAAESKVPVLTLPAFERATPPEAIKGESDLIEAIFASNKARGAVSDPVKGT